MMTLGLISVVGALLSRCSVLGVLALFGVALLCALATRLAFSMWKRTALRCFNQPPQRNWLLGHMGLMGHNEEGLQAVDEIIRKYVHSCAWYLGPFYNMVRLFHPDYVKSLLAASASITFKDELFYGFMKPWLGQSLLLQNGQEWSRHRRLLTPAFHFDILKKYVYIFNQSTNIMHDKWRSLLAAGQNGVDMFEHMSSMTLDSLLKCTFSCDSHCQGKPSEYITAISELSKLVIQRQHYLPYHWGWLYWRSEQGRLFRRACDIVHRFTANIVQERRAQLNQQGSANTPDENLEYTGGYRKKDTDLIDILLLSKDENGEGLTNKEIQAHADMFMFAGHDTTASALSWIFYNLAMHQEYQERCRDEITSVMRDRHTDVSWEELSQLPFTTMCIKESLRLHPPVLALTRYYSQNMKTPGGCVIPPGCLCLISIYGIHHNPDVWTDPEVYDPARFDPENSKGRSPHAFIPFSSGPRNCIGQNFAMAEIKVVVARTLMMFRILPGPKPVRRLYNLVLRAEGGLMLNLEMLRE
ncbi:cytochrome P450 4F3 [Xyrauchen texanus]|uniref:cytochrome P450 4F3 n=1 Tax=Xyrauchen texanus TaxID=154827 RepID=UPI002242201B|nr:cytochrome P450 4F3 [Xyrauchen texanus]XP_051958216.1 cytochrome P450 4F3 [Xyrauchen texanus]